MVHTLTVARDLMPLEARELDVRDHTQTVARDLMPKEARGLDVLARTCPFGSDAQFNSTLFPSSDWKVVPGGPWLNGHRPPRVHHEYFTMTAVATMMPPFYGTG